MRKTLAVSHHTPSQTTSKFQSRAFHKTAMDASADTSRTRPKNKNQHPGAIEAAGKRKRCTKTQIAEDNVAQEAKKKQEKGREAHQQIKNIANLEGEMAKKDADADSAHPRSQNGDISYSHYLSRY